MAYTSDEINGSQELRDDLYVAAMERMGVALEKGTDNEYHVVMRDPLVGLTEEEAADFKDHNPLTKGDIADIQGMQRGKYAEDYMKFERTEIVFTDEQKAYLESVKNTHAYGYAEQAYRNTAKENNEKYNKYAKEIELLVKANDPGYLNSLSQEDRDTICMQYTEYVLNHKSGVIGCTDYELSRMTDKGRESKVAESQEWVQTVMADVKEKYPNISVDNLAYPRSTEYNVFPDMKVPDYSKDDKSSQNTNDKDNKESGKNNSEKESPFKKLAATAAAVFTAAKNYLKETKVGQFVSEKYNELMHKDKNKDEKTNNSKETEENKESKESNTQRDDGSSIVNYDNQDNSSEYDDF